MNISTREKVLLAILFYGLLGFAIYKFVYLPLDEQITITKQENIQLTKQVDVMEMEKEHKLKELEKRQEAIEEYEGLVKKVPGDPNFVEMVKFLQTVANDADVELASISYKEQKNSDNKKAKNDEDKINIPELDFTISTTGGYYQLLTFLQSLEQSSRVITVSNCSLNANGKKDRRKAYSNSETAAGNYKNPPPQPPVAKGSRLQPEYYSSGPAQGSKKPPERAFDKYEPDSFTMQMQLAAYYDDLKLEI